MANNKQYVKVCNGTQVWRLVKELVESEVVAFDTETTGLSPRKDKIIGASFTTKQGTGYYIPTYVYNANAKKLQPFYININDQKLSGESVLSRVLTLLKGKKLVMHNASFDTGIVLSNYGIDLLPDLWIETTLAVHTVQEEGAFMYGKPFALKSIAKMCQEELGLDVDRQANEEQVQLYESVKRNGGSTTKSNFEIFKADLDILSEYACADTDLTYRIAKLYVGKIAEERLDKFFFEEEVMPVYKEVTVPMERRGLKVDLDLLQGTNEWIIQDMKRLKDEVVEALEELESFTNWLVDTAFGSECTPSNRGRFAQLFVKMYNLPIPKKESGDYHIVKKNVLKLPDSPMKQFLLDPNSDHGMKDLDLVMVSIEQWKEKNNGYTINIKSKSQLRDVAFKYMNIKPLSKTKKGSPRFDDDLVEKLSESYEWARKLRIHNRLVKIKSTYIDRLLREHENGIFYPYFKQHGTVSGRYGSNLQQLPKPKEEGEDDPLVIEYNNLIRAFFIARDGYKFIDADYESLEPHIFASITGDENLQEIFNKGHDFYSTVAIRTEKLKGVSADKKADNYLKKINAPLRNKAKPYSLGIAYGMSGYALAMTLGISPKRGERLRDAYLEGFPGVADWIESSRDYFKYKGKIVNKVGRVRHLDRGKAAYDTYGDRLMDYRFRSKLQKSIGKKQTMQYYRDYRNALNSCLNFQIQSLAASVVNRAALQINRKLKQQGLDALVVAQIHDQLVVECLQEHLTETAPIVQHLMETTTQLPGVTLKAPPEIATNLRDGH